MEIKITFETYEKKDKPMTMGQATLSNGDKVVIANKGGLAENKEDMISKITEVFKRSNY